MPEDYVPGVPETFHCFQDATALRGGDGPGHTKEPTSPRCCFFLYDPSWFVAFTAISKNIKTQALFSDEKMFTLQRCTTSNVWRLARQRNSPFKTKKLLRNRATGLLVWACICKAGLVKLTRIPSTLNAVGYQGVLAEVFGDVRTRASRKLQRRNRPFIHDNAPPHVAAVVQQYVHDIHLNVLPIPAQSPDINITENFWAMLSCKLRNATYTSKEALWEAVQTEAGRITPQFFEHLYNTYNERIRAIVKGRGNFAGY